MVVLKVDDEDVEARALKQLVVVKLVVVKLGVRSRVALVSWWFASVCCSSGGAAGPPLQRHLFPQVLDPRRRSGLTKRNTEAAAGAIVVT
jgi:hypothetical protein